MKRRLSIIIPGYNNPYDWWIRCVKSVLKAITADDEIICVDDGSSGDNTFLQKLTHLDKRIKVIYRKNGGLAEARNTGLKIAQGDYVTFIDSDDEIRVETFDKVFEEIKKSNSDIAFYGVHVIWPKLKLQKVDVLPTRFYGIPSNGDLEQIYKVGLLEYACNKVYRMTFLREHDIWFTPKVCPGEDTLFNLKCIACNATFSSVDFTGYIYYRTGKTICSRYVPFFEKNIKMRRAAWIGLESSLQGRGLFLRKKFIATEREIFYMAWKNMWRPLSPVSLYERWKFLETGREFLVRPRWVMFSSKLVYNFLRFCFYRYTVQRWWMKRSYPHCKEFKE